MTTTTDNTPYNWADDGNSFDRAAGNGERMGNAQQAGRDVGNGLFPGQQQGRTRHTHKEKTYNVNFGKGDGGNGAGGGGGQAPAGSPERHQGDQLIYAIEKLEFRSNKDIVALAKAINHLGRELHLILGMRAEELQGVLATYKSPWYTLGSGSKIKARLVAAHLKVSAEAAKALGVGALKMAYAFDRHFVKPEREARQKKNNQPKKPAFEIVED